MFLSNNARGKTDHLPDEERVWHSYCEILRPHCRSKASKILRCKNSNHCKIPYPHLLERTYSISSDARILQEFLFEFSEIAAPLTNLLSKKVKFVWTDDCQLAFDKVKLLLQKSHVLKSPDYEKPTRCCVSTGSFRWIGSPCQFIKNQRNYSVVKKETLGLVLALDHLDVYLGSTPFKIKVYTDHNPLTLLKTMKRIK